MVTVIDDNDGSKVPAGVQVDISGMQSQQASTDGSGVATFSGIPAGAYNITTTNTCFNTTGTNATVKPAATTPATLHVKPPHSVIAIKELAYSGNNPVENDTTGNFPAPEWLAGRSTQSPVAYARNKKVAFNAKFTVSTAPCMAETVTVKATATFGSASLEWNGSVTVNPGASEAGPVLLTSNNPLPNAIGIFETSTITWQMQAPTQSMASAGTTLNVLYVTLGDPSGTPSYWTLLDISCRAAGGDTDPNVAVPHFFTPFQGRSLNRKRDGHALTYWNPNTTTCTSTALLLASGDGSGQCGSWAEFFIDMLKAHGIAGADKIEIIRNTADRSTIGFLVKNWTFNHPPASSATAFTHKMGVECIAHQPPGLPGQNNPNPPPAFFNHFIARFNNIFFDPSYGSATVTTQTNWEAASIDGLFQKQTPPPHLTGFDKSLNATVLLLEFWNLTSGTKI